ncbi:hypothetical protein MMIC_P1589 [Mariprofundus micogutta]|uniref:Uncharacterized protein n=1 Tax=Mariprofundus micogutta TaxID=1921010 RepID=A0A1L8CNZ1_9PROT|nr:hypothetical protein MMIC_P1589 [Mariprofundus micogutta]
MIYSLLLGSPATDKTSSLSLRIPCNNQGIPYVELLSISHSFIRFPSHLLHRDIDVYSLDSWYR